MRIESPSKRKTSFLFTSGCSFLGFDGVEVKGKPQNCMITEDMMNVLHSPMITRGPNGVKIVGEGKEFTSTASSSEYGVLSARRGCFYLPGLWSVWEGTNYHRFTTATLFTNTFRFPIASPPQAICSTLNAPQREIPRPNPLFSSTEINSPEGGELRRREP